jgi:hypothetical protein
MDKKEAVEEINEILDKHNIMLVPVPEYRQLMDNKWVTEIQIRVVERDKSTSQQLDKE